MFWLLHIPHSNLILPLASSLWHLSTTLSLQTENAAIWQIRTWFILLPIPPSLSELQTPSTIAISSVTVCLPESHHHLLCPVNQSITQSITQYLYSTSSRSLLRDASNPGQAENNINMKYISDYLTYHYLFYQQTTWAMSKNNKTFVPTVESIFSLLGHPSTSQSEGSGSCYEQWTLEMRSMQPGSGKSGCSRSSVHRWATDESSQRPSCNSAQEAPEQAQRTLWVKNIKIR